MKNEQNRNTDKIVKDESNEATTPQEMVTLDAGALLRKDSKEKVDQSTETKHKTPAKEEGSQTDIPSVAEIKSELEKSKREGRTTERIKNIMKDIPLSTLHLDVKENTMSSGKLAERIAGALSKQSEKKKVNQSQKNDQGSGARIYFS